MSIDFQKVSLTAKLAAYMRQYTDIPFAREVARALRAQEAFEQLLAAQHMRPEDLLWYAPIFEVRYKSIAEMLRRSGLKQVLELASGFSLRGLVTTRDASLTYVESDLEDLTAEKTTLVSDLCQQYKLAFPENLHFAAANALDENQLWAAVKNFQLNQPIAVINEGLLLYLSSDEMETLAKNVCNLLANFGGLWITPDFSLKSEAQDVSAQQRRFRAIVTAATDRPMYNNAFDTPAELSAFFAGLGLHEQVFNQLDLAPQIVSPGVLKLSPRFLADSAPRLKLWALSLDAPHDWQGLSL